MKHLKIADYKITLNNRDWEQLVKRFDVDKADPVTHLINIGCVCNYYGERCEGCPFFISTSKRLGCMRVAYSLLGNFKLLLGYHGMHWRAEDDAQARAEIQKIRDWLLSAEDVNK